MPYENAHLFREMSYQQFKYSTQDLDTLRSKVRALERELPRSMIQTMNRQQLIDAILACEYSDQAVVDYKSFALQNNNLKKFVEGKIPKSKV